MFRLAKKLLCVAHKKTGQFSGLPGVIRLKAIKKQRMVGRTAFSRSAPVTELQCPALVQLQVPVRVRPLSSKAQNGFYRSWDLCGHRPA
jgi:hypothetical protein